MPPSSPISIAMRGDTAPSIAEPMTGRSSLNASSSQEMSTSSGSRVRRLGTTAMSSNPYARRPDLPMPISTSNPVPPTPLWPPRLGKLQASPGRPPICGSGAGPVAPVAGHVDVDDPGQEPGQDPGGRAPDRLVGELVELHGALGAVEAPRPALLVVHLVGEELGERDVEDAVHLARVGGDDRSAIGDPDERRDVELPDDRPERR